MSTFTPEEFAIMHINDLERHKFVLTSDGKIAIRILGGSGGDMLKSENLAGLTDYAIARSNLEVYSSDEIDDLLTGYALAGHDHSGVYEPVFSKNTGFNKNFGTTVGTVLEGSRDALYEKFANKGQANGYAPLDSNSLIPSMYLPSYVDDVIDVALYANLPGTGEAGKIYNVYGDTVSLNGSYRWGGAAYSKISSVSDAVWGHITGTLADQADLVSALAGKAALSHTHVLADLPAISQNHFLGRDSAGSGTIEVLSATQTRSALSVYSQSEIDGFTVKLTENQTIAGVKTFSSNILISTASATSFISGSGNGCDFFLGDPDTAFRASYSINRNVDSSVSQVPVMQVQQQHTGDDQTTLRLSNFGSGKVLEVLGNGTGPSATFAGNVGIGTNPLSRLHAYQSGTGVVATIESGGEYTALKLLNSSGGASDWELRSNDNMNLLSPYNTFSINAGSSYNPAFMIQSNLNATFYGNVGINELNPIHRLNVNGTFGIQSDFLGKFSSQTGYSLLMKLSQGNATTGYQDIHIVPDYIKSGDRTGGTRIMYGFNSEIDKIEYYSKSGDGVNRLLLGIEKHDITTSKGVILIGGYRLWVDSSGRLRIKSSTPTTDTDGTIVGTQS